MTETALDLNTINTIRSFSNEVKPTVPSNNSQSENKVGKLIQGHPERKNQEKNFSTGILHELSKELNRYLEGHQTSMGFFIHKKLDNQVVVEIKNKNTGEIVRQIPSEELLKIRERMVTSTGLIFDAIG